MGINDDSKANANPSVAEGAPASEGPVSPRALAGCCGFGSNRQRYVKTLSLVEVQQTFFNPPRPATLRQWRAAAPAPFVFSIRAWQLITHEPPAHGTYPRLGKNITASTAECGLFRPSIQVEQAYQRTLDAAQALDASAIVFETPVQFTPTAEHRRRLGRFFETIDRRDLLMVWDPQGVWSDEQVRRICLDLDLVHCGGPLDEPLGEHAYLRLRAPRISDEELLRIAQAVEDTTTALVLFNNINMFRDAHRLQALLPSPGTAP